VGGNAGRGRVGVRPVPEEPDGEKATRSLDADAAAVAGVKAPSSRVALDRQRILDAAVAYVDEHGLARLTMRAVGGELRVEAMSLYRHVDGREGLLDGIVDTIIAETYDDPEVIVTPEHGWQDFLQRLAHGIRRVALRHPSAFPLVASRPPEAPWLRPPLRNLRWVESFFDGLAAEGFSDDVAVVAYRAFTSFLLGHLLLEVAARGADIGPLDVLDTADEPDDALASFPHVRRHRVALAEDQSAVEFEESLENLLERVALQLAQSER
jgi:AcrR family transcriptional regulator